MYENELIQAGLTTNEAKVYVALLKLGKSTSGKIIEEANISSGKIYETLQKLTQKGLIEIVIENGTKKFHVGNPQSLLLYMKEKEKKISQQAKELEKIIPQLEEMRHWEEQSEGVFLIKGLRGIKPLVYEVLTQNSSEIKIMGVRSSKQKMFNTFWQHWHTQRILQQKKAKVLFSDRNTEFWQTFKQMKHTTVKSITSLSPSSIMIIGNHSFIFSYEPEFTCIHILTPAIAKSFTSFFDSLWLIAKP